MTETIIDLSHRMIPGKPQFKLEAQCFDVTEILPDVKHRPDIWYVLSEMTMSSHEATHVEFPYHHWKEGADAADYPLENLIGYAVVLDFSHKKHGEEITLDEMLPFESRMRGADMIFIRTDMDRLFRDPDHWTDQPYLAADAMQWIIDEIKPKVVGTDATGFEVPGTDYQPNHLAIFKNGIAMIESLTNLDKIGDDKVKVFILPLPIEGIDSCPVRIIAIKEEN